MSWDWVIVMAGWWVGVRPQSMVVILRGVEVVAERERSCECR